MCVLYSSCWNIAWFGFKVCVFWQLQQSTSDLSVSGGNGCYINTATRKKNIMDMYPSLRCCLPRNKVNIGEIIWRHFVPCIRNTHVYVWQITGAAFLSLAIRVGLRENKIICKTEYPLCLPPLFSVIFQILSPKEDIMSTSVHTLTGLLRVGPLKKYSCPKTDSVICIFHNSPLTALITCTLSLWFAVIGCY